MTIRNLMNICFAAIAAIDNFFQAMFNIFVGKVAGATIVFKNHHLDLIDSGGRGFALAGSSAATDHADVLKADTGHMTDHLDIVGTRILRRLRNFALSARTAWGSIVDYTKTLGGTLNTDIVVAGSSA